MATNGIPQGFSAARIIAKRYLSPTVVQLELETSPSFSFQPGQWVDFIAASSAAADTSWVGGFSLTSGPEDLPVCRLAVKSSNQAPAQWVHTQARPGNEVYLRVDGSCVLVPSCLRFSVFCAGGIGIAPILSLYRSFLKQQNGTAFLYYSVSTEKELVFREELRALAPQHGHMVWTLTSPDAVWTTTTETSSNIELCTGRRLRDFLCNVSKMTSHNESHYYLCGPPSLTDEAILILESFQVPAERIHYEKWW